jgi:hypothetical protein
MDWSHESHNPRQDWPRLYERAASVLEHRLRQERELPPQRVAETVAAALPLTLGQWLLQTLEARGWLTTEARLSFDLLDSEACPAEFRGPMREVARLAVFGLPGQGRPDFKHREATCQQICAEITREASSLARLQGAATRALSHPEVCRDPVLAGMVRSFIIEREHALRTEQRVEGQGPKDETKLRHPFEASPAAEFPTRQQLQASFLRYQKDFEVHLAQYNEAAAKYSLEKMQDLGRRFPVHVDRASLLVHEEHFEEFSQRCESMRRQVDDVAKRAADAACQGDVKTAAWLIRRLRAIHALMPAFLSAERFEQLREDVERSGREREHREVLTELMSREREVAAEIKRAGAAIYRFHQVSRTIPADSEEYKRAEIAYRQAVARVRLRDTEWLTGLLLELETYLGDLDDAAGHNQEQLDRFIGTVRSALNQLRMEIRAIQAERGGGTVVPSPTMPPPGQPIAGQAPAPPVA